MNDFLKFSLLLMALLLAALAMHLYILKGLGLHMWDNKILLAYSMNYILAVAIYGALYLLQEKMTSQLGFLYMGGSLLRHVECRIRGLLNPLLNQPDTRDFRHYQISKKIELEFVSNQIKILHLHRFFIAKITRYRCKVSFSQNSLQSRF